MDKHQMIVSMFFEKHYLIRMTFQLFVFILCLINVFNAFANKPGNSGMTFMFDIGIVLYVIFVTYNSDFAARVPNKEDLKWGYNLKEIVERLDPINSDKQRQIIVDEIQDARKKKNKVGRILALFLIVYFTAFMILGIRLNFFNGYYFIITGIMIASGLFILWLRNLFSQIMIVYGQVKDEKDSKK